MKALGSETHHDALVVVQHSVLPSSASAWRHGTGGTR